MATQQDIDAAFAVVRSEWNKAERAIKLAEQVNSEIVNPAIYELRYGRPHLASKNRPRQRHGLIGWSGVKGTSPAASGDPPALVSLLPDGAVGLVSRRHCPVRSDRVRFPTAPAGCSLCNMRRAHPVTLCRPIAARLGTSSA